MKSAFPCCGGSDENPPEHTQDCGDLQGQVSRLKDQVKTLLLNGAELRQAAKTASAQADALTNELRHVQKDVDQARIERDHERNRAETYRLERESFRDSYEKAVKERDQARGRYMEAMERFRSVEQLLRNILARIHRDGGQRQDSFPSLAEATADADTIVAQLYTQVTETLYALRQRFKKSKYGWWRTQHVIEELEAFEKEIKK